MQNAFILIFLPKKVLNKREKQDNKAQTNEQNVQTRCISLDLVISQTTLNASKKGISKKRQAKIP